jgi:hypothetical protein
VILPVICRPMNLGGRGLNQPRSARRHRAASGDLKDAVIAQARKNREQAYFEPRRVHPGARRRRGRDVRRRPRCASRSAVIDARAKGRGRRCWDRSVLLQEGSEGYLRSDPQAPCHP